MPFSIFKSVDGVDHGDAEDYFGYIEDGSSIAMPSTVSYGSRFGQRPIRNSLTIEPRQVPFDVTRGAAGTATDPDAWWENVRRIYGEYRGERVVVATHEGVDVYLTTDVISLDLVGPFHARGMFSAADGVWTAVSAGSAVTSSPITPGGNSDAFPILTITPTGSNVNYRAITVTPNNDEGLTDYPLMIGGTSTEGGALALNTVSAPAASDSMLIVDGQPVPFFVKGYNTATGAIVATFSGKPGEAIPAYLFYGTNIDNTTFAQQFQNGGLKLDSASFTNSTIVYRVAPATVDGTPHTSIFDQHAALVRPLSFHPSLAVGGSGWTTQKIFAFDTGTFYQLSVGGTTGTDANSYAAILPLPADTMQFLKAVDGTLTELAQWLFYRKRGVPYFNFQPTTGFETQDTHDIDDATLILLRLQGVAAFRSYAIAAPSTQVDPVLTLKTATLPTISIGAAQVGHRLHMDIETPRSTIQIRDCYTANVALTIDTLNQTIAPASGDILYFGPGGGITFTSRDEWVPLTAGTANAYTVTNLGGSSVTLSWSVPARYAL